MSQPARVETVFNLSAGCVDAQNRQQKKLDHSVWPYRGTIFFCYTPRSFVFAQTIIAVRSMVRSPAVSHPGVPPVNEGRNVCQEALRLDASVGHDEEEG
jgi:hypothetical protein